LLTFFKVERNAALLLLAAGILGLIVANTPAASLAAAIGSQQFTIMGFDLDVHGFVGEFLMTGFFMLIGLELKRELHSGVFRDRRAIALPAMSAVLGAVVPAVVFFALVGPHTDASGGWPIPMATDVTFALAIFSVFAKTMPASARTFLLSFAVIDDVIAIAVIAIFLGSGLNFAYLVAAIFTVWAYAYVSRLAGPLGLISSLIAATAAWSFTALAGISPVVVGVALGLVTAASRVEAIEKRLHPWVSLLVLPIFAFFATGVSLAGGLVLTSAMTIAILARPLGKIVGINVGAALARILVKNSGFDDLRSGQIARISTLGGIGFTVALLIANQIFGAGSDLANQAIVATLAAMVVSMVVGAVALSWRRT
jgi:NhaA family Na+:H+ antiporter